MALKGNLLKAALISASGLTVMSGATIAPSLPGLVDQFGDRFSETTIKLALTLPGLSIALIAPVSGWLGDHLPKKTLLFWATLIYALAGCSGLYLDDFRLILAGRVVLGLAVAFTMTMAIALVADYFDGPERQRYLGAQSAAMSGCGVIFMTTGGWLAELSWRGPFAVYSLSLLVALLVTQLPDPPEKPLTHEIPSSSKDLLKLLPIYILSFLTMLIFYIVPVQLPFLIEREGIGSASDSGIAIACSNMMAAITSLFLFSRLRRRWAPPGILVVGFIIVAAGYWIIRESHSYSGILVSMALSGAAIGVIFPNFTSWLLQEATPQLRGRATGLLSAFFFSAQFLTPIIIAPLFDDGTPPREAFGTVSILLLAGSAIAGSWLLLPNIRRRRPITKGA